MLNNQWGYSEDIITAEPNDKLRLFGIIMALDKNRHIFERLASGATRREYIDDPEYNPSMMFQDLCLDFNNELILVLLPSKAYDVMGIEEMDANDSSRIKIYRDCKHVIIISFFIISCTLLYIKFIFILCYISLQGSG